jgi:hypothetical protein
MGEQDIAVMEEASPHSIRRISMQLHKMLQWPLRFPDEAIGYLPLLSGGLLCRIANMEFRGSPFHEVG